MWLIRAIINGNIIIQASISKRSHLNEYIFCLGAVAASEPLKRKERMNKKNKKKPPVQSWRMGSKGLSAEKWESRALGTVSGLTWCSLCDHGQDLVSHLNTQGIN